MAIVTFEHSDIIKSLGERNAGRDESSNAN